MDLSDLANWLDDVADGVKSEIEKSVEKGAMKIANDAKARCPVDTGTLRNSIQTEVDWEGDICMGIIGTNVPYSVYCEFGTGIYAENGQGRQTPWVYKDSRGWHTTQGQHPQPFMYPALYANKDRVLSEIAEDIRRIFDGYN